MELLGQYWAVLLPLLAVFWFLLTRINPGSSAYPYVKKSSIMTNNERDFYFALLKAVGGKYDIFGMVRMADLLSVTSGATKRQSWQGRINGKHIDFVLCDRNSQEPLLAIEVDDRSHLKQDRRERDYFVDRAFVAAGLPLLRVTATRKYAPGELSDAIKLELRKPSKRLASERRVKVG